VRVEKVATVDAVATFFVFLIYPAWHISQL